MIRELIPIEPRNLHCVADRRDPRSRRRVPLGMIPAPARDANTIHAEIDGRRHIFAWAGASGDLSIRPLGSDPRSPHAAEVWKNPAQITGPRLPTYLGEAARIGTERI